MGVYILRTEPHWALLIPHWAQKSPTEHRRPTLTPNWPLTISTKSHWPQLSPVEPNVASTDPTELYQPISDP